MRGGLNGKCRSFVRDLNFLPALHTPLQFSLIAQTTAHWSCAYWTAGFKVRPPDIGSANGYTIFQVYIYIKSNNYVYFRQVWKLLGGFCVNLPIIRLGQRWDVKLFSHEIYAASRLFCTHSAGLLVRATCRVSDRYIFHEYFGRNGVIRGQNLGI